MHCVAAVEAKTALKAEKPAAKKAKQKKRGRSKAFDTVLEKEDVEGPIVVTSAGDDGQSSHAKQAWQRAPSNSSSSDSSATEIFIFPYHILTSVMVSLAM